LKILLKRAVSWELLDPACSNLNEKFLWGKPRNP